MTRQIIRLHPDSRQRLDKYVAACVAGLSRSAVQRLIDDGLVTVNGATSESARRVGQGDEVVVRIPPPAAVAVEAEEIPLSIIYEDSDLIVVDKPAGLVVHPAVGHDRGTLVNALLTRAPELKGVGGESRSGIVHRLDKDTSGLIVVAKHDDARRNLQRQFKMRTVKKTYLALVEGRVEPEEGIIEAPIARDRVYRKRMAVAATGRPARTGYRVIRYVNLQVGALAGTPSRAAKPAKASGPVEFTLVEAYPETGRTHQIRVHFAWLGHPVAGDRVYGRKKPSLPIERHFLHAFRLALRLPSSGEERVFESPLPDDLASVLQALQQVDSG